MRFHLTKLIALIHAPRLATCLIASREERGSQSLSVISIKHTPTPKI